MVTQTNKIKLLNNANKLVFLIQAFPDLPLSQIIEKFSLPAIDINSAMWYAEDIGFMDKPDETTGVATLKKVPKKLVFDNDYYVLKELVKYCFEHLAKVEQDMQREVFDGWVVGYPLHDAQIVVQELLQEKFLAEYGIEEDGGTYSFITTYANKDKLWGRKHFKTDPLAEKPADEDSSN